MIKNTRHITTSIVRRGRFFFIARSAPPKAGEAYHTTISTLAVGTRFSSTNSSMGHHRNVVQSPLPNIPSGPYPPIPEFLSEEWHLFGNKVAIVDGTTNQRRTFQEYEESMRSIGASLRHRLGVGLGDTVLLFSPNHVDYLPLILGIGMTGATVTPINPLTTPLELRKMIHQTQPKVILAHERVLDVAIQAVALEDESSSVGKGSTVEHIVCIPHLDDNKTIKGNTTTNTTSTKYGSTTTILHLNDLKHHPTPLESTAIPNRSGYDYPNYFDTHPFILPFSSGTTGLPKGICLSHSNLVANLLQTHITEGVSFHSHHSLISPLPFYHIYGLVVSLMYAARYGQTLITTSGRFDLKEFCQLVQTHEPKRAHLVPPIILGLAKAPISHNMSSLRLIVSAAAPLSAELEHEVSQKIKNCKIKQGWGMSELSPLGTIAPDDQHKAGSVGRLVSSTLGKIIDLETGENLGPGEIGELVIKGPQVMMGYKDNPAATAECLSDDGWLRTGDIAYYDTDGFFFITDRKKEMMKVRGFPVFPAELEGLLVTHEHIQDVAVIPKLCDTSGEVPKAYIVLKPNINLKEEEILSWVKERVSPHKRLAGGITFTHEIPKSPSGKILRRVLRDLDRAAPKSN